MSWIKSLLLSSLITVLLMTLSMSLYLLISVDGVFLEKINTLVYFFPTFFGIMAIIYLAFFIFYVPILYKLNNYYFLTENGLISLSLVGSFILASFVGIMAYMISSDFLRSVFIFMTLLFVIPFNLKLFIELTKIKNEPPVQKM